MYSFIVLLIHVNIKETYIPKSMDLEQKAYFLHVVSVNYIFNRRVVVKTKLRRTIYSKKYEFCTKIS